MQHLSKAEIGSELPSMVADLLSEALEDNTNHFVVDEAIHSTRQEADAILTVEALNLSISFEDDPHELRQEGYSQGHGHAVNVLAQAVNRQMGTPVDPIVMSLAAFYHDVDKNGTHWNDVKMKEGAPSEEQFESVIFPHARMGAKKLFATWSSSPDLFEKFGFTKKMVNEAGRIIHGHHERIDGRGYYGMHKDKVHPGSFIIGTVDAYEVMNRASRAYQFVMETSAICEEMKRSSGMDFDADLTTRKRTELQFCRVAVEALLNLMPDIGQGKKGRLIHVPMHGKVAGEETMVQ